LRLIPAGSVLLGPLPDGHGEVEVGWQFHPAERWYHERLLMFWIGSSAQREPSLARDGPA
jgi:hypothetical protein